MSELIWHTEPRTDRPIVVLAFRGLFDAASAATNAVAWLRERAPSTRLAHLDPEMLFDFTQERPSVRVLPSGRREIVWPENEFHSLRFDGPRDLVVCAGTEPHLRWRTFGEHILSVAHRCGAEMVVTLGAMVGVVPHTRPLPVTGSSTNPELAARLGLGSPSYEGPTGVIGTLHDLLDQAGMPVISLRVAVPHYVPAPPNPKATYALLRRFEQVTGIDVGSRALEARAADWERQVRAAAADDDQVLTYVRRLEEQYDAEEPLPSGDDLAAELEAFLREQRGTDDGA
jgi:proteasome assembly chaperone (PAC2) family protein